MCGKVKKHCITLNWNDVCPLFFMILKVLHSKCSEPLAQQAKCDRVITCGIGDESGATLAVGAFGISWSVGARNCLEGSPGKQPPTSSMYRIFWHCPSLE